jgi:dCTP deaminase
MILTGKEIEKQVLKKNIILSPFDRSHLTTNSYDLTLGEDYIVYSDKVIDPAKKIKFKVKKIPKTGLRLKKKDFILGHSVEVVGSNHYVPIIHAKSSIARLGLFVHITADLIDIGSIGNVTFQLYSTLPITIYPGMLIGQVSFWVPKGKIRLYKGKYQNSKGPRASEISKDFHSKNRLR